MPLVVLLAIVLNACGDLPERTRLERVQFLFESAEMANAELYAPELMVQTREALSAAEKEYAEQEGAWFFHSPERGHQLVAHALKLAQELSRVTQDASKEAGKDAREALRRAEIAVLDAEAVLSRLARCARERKVHGLREYGDRYVAIQEDLSEATSLVDHGDYPGSEKVSAQLEGLAHQFVKQARNTATDHNCR